jgi:hypothetical protein
MEKNYSNPSKNNVGPVDKCILAETHDKCSACDQGYAVPTPLIFWLVENKFC